MSESFVDLTYRGISLGKRIKLGLVRPSTGFLELAAPMPVGTPLVIATDDGVAIEATVTWVHEQITGAERPAGMVVSPALAVEDAAAWWQARIELPEEEAPRRLTRTRPVTLRPRTQTLQTPPPEGALAEPAPSLAADLAARVAAAAGVAPPSVKPAAPILPTGDPTPLEPGRSGSMRRTGEHQVIDDGHHTTIMQALDPVALGLEPRTASDTDPTALGPPTEAETAVPMATADANDPTGMEVTIDTSGDSTDDAGDDDASDGDAAPTTETETETTGDKPGNGRSGGTRKRKRKR